MLSPAQFYVPSPSLQRVFTPLQSREKLASLRSPAADFLTDDAGYESGCEGRICSQFEVSRRRRNSLQVRRARELITPGASSALRAVSAMTALSTKPPSPYISDTCLSKPLQAIDQPAAPSHSRQPKMVVGLGIGFPSGHPLCNTSGGITPQTFSPTLAIRTASSPSPRRLSLLEFKQSPRCAMNIHMAHLRPTVVQDSPSPIDALPSPMVSRSRWHASSRRVASNPSIPLTPFQSLGRQQHQTRHEGLPQQMESLPFPLLTSVHDPSLISSSIESSHVPEIRPRRTTQSGWPSLQPSVVSPSAVLVSNLVKSPRVKLQTSKIGLGLSNIWSTSSPLFSPLSPFCLEDVTMERSPTCRENTTSSSFSPDAEPGRSVTFNGSPGFESHSRPYKNIFGFISPQGADSSDCTRFFTPALVPWPLKIADNHNALERPDTWMPLDAASPTLLEDTSLISSLRIPDASWQTIKVAFFTMVDYMNNLGGVSNSAPESEHSTDDRGSRDQGNEDFDSHFIALL